MIRINLLPEEFKKRQGPKRSLVLDIPKFGPLFLKAGIGLLSVLLGIHFLFGLSILLKAASLKRMDKKWQGLHPNRAEVERLKAETSSMEKKVLPIKRLFSQRMLWSRQLNQLSNLTTTGVWLTGLFIRTEARDAKAGEYVRILNLEGSAASLYGDEAALIARFVNALQEDKDFFQHFSEIKLGPIEKVMLENVPVMNFKVYCFFKKKD